MNKDKLVRKLYISNVNMGFSFWRDNALYVIDGKRNIMCAMCINMRVGGVLC